MMPPRGGAAFRGRRAVVAKMRPGRLLLVIGALVVAVWWWNSSTGFAEADIENMKRSIREEYNKKPGFSVREVVLVKESSNKASGFVTVNQANFGEFTKSCTASMSDSGKGYWRCN